VPKFIPGADGKPGKRNSAKCASIEHKLGIHASPTAVMVYDKAAGYLVGEENRGLEYMFIMMNAARFAVGLEGVAIAERAFQRALAFSKERLQAATWWRAARPCRSSASGRAAHADADEIAGRGDARACLHHRRGDGFCHKSENPAERKRHQAYVDLMIPVVKAGAPRPASRSPPWRAGAWRHGFIEETGAAQYLRDARITTIYEGTTGIQAMDLVGRKIAREAVKLRSNGSPN